jgi:hypothetical protein
MDDIFDDVDSILDGDVSSEEETTNFNESELHDIMSEIEDLEKEFEAVDVPMTLQEQIDAELAMGLEEATSEVSTVVETAPVVEVVETKAQVLAFEKVAPVAVVTPTTTSTNTSSGVSFAAHGQMSLNLDFMVGQETAKLTVDPVKGLVVTLSGVELCISEDSGCTVSMENGMKFTIPLTSSANSTKKKSA